MYSPVSVVATVVQFVNGKEDPARLVEVRGVGTPVSGVEPVPSSGIVLLSGAVPESGEVDVPLTGSVPLTIGSVPLTTGIVPLTTGIVPFTTGIVPFTIGIVPFTTGGIVVLFADGSGMIGGVVHGDESIKFGV